MMNKIRILALSPKISCVSRYEIDNYLLDKYPNISTEGTWILANNGTGIELKILNTGIVEIEENTQSLNIKEELTKLAREIKDISADLFDVSPVYNVTISQAPISNFKIYKNIIVNRKINSMQLYFGESARVNLELDSYEYSITMTQIREIDDIVNIYYGIEHSNEDLLKDIGLNHLTIQETVF
jgi:hypothetical protein